MGDLPESDVGVAGQQGAEASELPPSDGEQSNPLAIDDANPPPQLGDDDAPDDSVSPLTQDETQGEEESPPVDGAEGSGALSDGEQSNPSSAVTEYSNPQSELGYSDFTSPTTSSEDPLLAEERAMEGEDEDALIILDPEHPLVERFQAALKNHLTKQLDRLNEDLKEKLGQEKSQLKRRDELGESLSTVQEHLLTCLTSLEDHHQAIALAAAERQQAQEQLEVTKGQYHGLADQVSEDRNLVSQLQAAKENLRLRLHYMQEITTDLRSDIKAMKMATGKAQAEMTAAEESKYGQDLYVERLMEEMDRLTESVGIYEAKAVAQAKETRAAKEYILEATMAMDSLKMERRQMLGQWNSSLVALRKKDQEYLEMQNSLRVADKELLLLDYQIQDYKKATAKEQDRNEQLHVALKQAKLNSATNRIMIRQSQAEQEALQAEYNTYECTLQEKKGLLDRLNKESDRNQVHMRDLNKQLENEAAVSVDLREKIMAQIAQELAHNKVAKSSKQLIDQLAEGKKDRIAHLWKMEDDIATARLDSSDVRQRIAELTRGLAEREQEIVRYNTLLTESQAKINVRVNVIKNKGITINTLKTKIKNIEVSSGQENLKLYELQTTANTLAKELEVLDGQNNEDQQLWMDQQQELVSLTEERQAARDERIHQQTLYMVLEQRKIRIDGEIGGQQRELGQLERDRRTLLSDVMRLNSLLNKKGQMQQDLENENLLMENDFVRRIKEAEEASIEMQMKLEGILDEKEQLLGRLAETEHQVMLWEKKLQLTKEVRSYMDVGQEDIALMRLEIHRMEGNYGRLMKQQQQLIRESEATVNKKDSIVLHCEAQAGRSAHADHKTTAHSDHLVRINQGLCRKIQENHKQVVKCEQTIKELLERKADLDGGLEEKKRQLTELRRRSAALAFDLRSLQDTKERNFSCLLALQSRAAKLQAVREGRYKALSSAEQVEHMLERQRDRVRQVSSIVQRVSEEFPQHQGALRKLKLMLEAKQVM